MVQSPAEIKVSAPGNLFLTGEHFTVYTKSAIIVAPDFRTTVSVKPAECLLVYSLSLDERCEVELVGGKLVYDKNRVNKELVPALRVIEKVGEDYEVNIKPMKIVIDSEIPVAGHMSSSTAFMTAEYFAIAKFHGEDPWLLNAKEVYNRLLPIQEFIHGKASGMEIYSSWGGGFSLVKDKNLIKSYQVPEDKMPVCLIGYTGVKTPTSISVANFKKWKDGNPQEYTQAENEVNKIIEHMDECITAYDWDEVGSLMTENHAILYTAGVSHSLLNDGVKAAISAGAYGAKMSGAGAGGAMFAICSDKKSKAVEKALREVMTPAGGDVYRTKLGAKGVGLL